MKRALRKLGDYAAMGIQQIWLIDPETNSCHQHTQGKLVTAMHFGAHGDRMYFEMSEIEAFLD